MPDDLYDAPQPDESEWKFIYELQTPFHQKVKWKRQKPQEVEIKRRWGTENDWFLKVRDSG